MSDSRDDQPDWLADDASGVLAAAREQRAAADRAEANLLQLAVRWAVIHPAESLDHAETLHGLGGDIGIPLAGPGSPLVAEFSIAEFGTALGLTAEAGKRYLGDALELAYRLRRIWARVLDGTLPAWRARRIAQQTTLLSKVAADYLDRQLAPVAHRVGAAQVDRLITAALAHYQPDQAEEQRRKEWDQRHLTIDYSTTGIAGTCQLFGEIDLADALDLDHALSVDAQTQADLGSVATLDQRRATALGNLARRDHTLTYPTQPDGDPEAAPDAKPARKSRQREVVLYLHLAGAAVTGRSAACTVGRVENTNSPVSVETIRAWCGHPDTHVTVKPVIDLAEHVHVTQYEVPDRIREHLALRDVTCIFPWCTRPARRLRPGQHAADCDHCHPYTSGGATCPCQIAPLCRRHHRLKTHGGWRYVILEPGSYLWTSPHGYHYLRDHTGTQDVSRDQHRGQPPDPDPPDPPDPPDE